MTRRACGLIFVLLAFVGCKKDDPAKETEPSVQSSVQAAVSKSPGGFTDCMKLCRIVGKCTLRDGGCYASSETDCQNSLGCRTVGYCSLENDKCVAKHDSDCTKAEICTLQGRCMAVNGQCANMSAPAASASNEPAK